MREYETTIIIQPEISDESSAEFLAKLDGILADQGATRLMCEDLGKRKLAYEIRKFHKGHYHILSFLDEGKIVPTLERTLRLEESVLRFMTIQVSDRVTDIEARKADAAEREVEQQKRAEEKAKREAEEAAARAEAERIAAQEAAEAAAKAEAAAAEAATAAAAEAEAEAGDESGESGETEESGDAAATPAGEETAAPSAEGDDEGENK